MSEPELQKYVVRIATPYSMGVGFLLPNLDYIATTIQTVKDNYEVIIDNQDLKPQLVRVLSLDPLNGIAFLDIPEPFKGVSLEIGDSDVEPGSKVLAYGMPGLNTCNSCEGHTLDEAYEENGCSFIVHDCPISYDCIGGVLTNAEHQVLALNMHLTRDIENVLRVFAMPIRAIETIAEGFLEIGGEGVRCENCNHLNAPDNRRKSQCKNCGTILEYPAQASPYEPIGVASTIEQMIDRSGRDVRLSRRGPNAWEIFQGSAKVEITYYDKEGLIMGDAYLCLLPEEENDQLYRYLLGQNNQMEGLSFSVKGQEIVLSLMIYDGHLNVDTGFELLQYLLKQADYYDNVLVEEFGAEWKDETVARNVLNS